MAERRILGAPEVRRRMDALREHLSAADFERLGKLLSAFPAGGQPKARLSTAIAKVTTGSAGEDRLASFRAFRLRFASAAKLARLGWTLEVDTKKRSDPSERHCWFLAPADDDTADKVAALSRPVSNPGEPFVPMLGVPTMGRHTVRFFVSFNDAKDRHRANALLEELQACFRLSDKYDYQIWHEGQILPGEIIASEIEKALEQADLGLLLLSVYHHPKVGDDDRRLHALVETGKPLVPVALGNLPTSKSDVRDSLTFRSQKRSSFSECRNSRERSAFVHELFEQIEAKLDRSFAAPEATPEAAPTALVRRTRARTALLERRRLDDATARELMFAHDRWDLAGFVPSSGADATFADDLDRTPPADPNRAVNLLETLHAWARDRAGTRYAAILGEYGMGKTTLLRKLTDELLEQRKSDPALPLPIFIDLRTYHEGIQKDGRLPRDIDDLLAEMLPRARRDASPPIEPQDLLRLVREEGAILIFDGLDEKLVHLTEAQGQAFIRTLWQALPQQRVDPSREEESAGTPGKLIFSCRSHYFKSLRSQSALFLGEDREGLRASSYRAWVLLPFDESQIRRYLANTLGDERVDAAMELFAAIHNLGELAQRPYLLSLITAQIDALERKRMRGESVQGVTIYELLVERWLERDNGKHKLRPEDKPRMMEEIAAAMWAEGSRAWPWERLRDWLGARLASDAVLRTRYAGVAPELLEEDLRTATFVLRPDDSAREFRFAHTSLLEYFLAKHLFRALAEGAAEPWSRVARQLPSPEAFEFLGQLIAIESDARVRAACLTTLSSLLGGEHPEAAGVAFRYWVQAVPRRLPEPRPARIDLRGADLSRLVVRGRSEKERLPLRGADLTGASLMQSVWEDVDLSGASLASVRALRAEFQRVIARGIDVSGADLTGVLWRGCDAEGLRGGATAEWYDCAWIGSRIDAAALPAGFERLGTIDSAGERQGLPDGGNLPAEMLLATRSGHGLAVNWCAWSPDGSQFLSASSDKTVILWDGRSGNKLLTLAGHRYRVYASAWSPDGAKILSASYDGTIKIWDSRSGRELLTFAAHNNSISDCAWSPDGTRLLSASYDNTLKVWDACTGEGLLTLAGHVRRVYACAWSYDGTKIASGSDDNTIRLWDAHSGRPLLTLEGHHSTVYACTFSPDDTHILSGSADHSLKLWDVRSGQELITLAGHKAQVLTCAWSPEGDRVVSGSQDKTVRLWEARSGRNLLTIAAHDDAVYACCFSPDGTKLLSGSADGTLAIWDACTGGNLLTSADHPRPVFACAFSPDGTHLLAGSFDKTLSLWDAGSGREVLSLVHHHSPISACAFSPQGTQLASGSWDATLRLYDARSGHEQFTLVGHRDSVNACAFSPDGTQLLSGSSDATLKLWDLRSGREILTFLRHGSTVSACAFSPDGSQVLSGSWDRTLKVWSARSGHEILTLIGHAGFITACAWSPDTTTLISCSEDHSIKLWDARSGLEILTLTGHQRSVLACAFSPDGALILSASDDNTLKIWQARSGKELLTLSGHQTSISACAFSPDGSTILSGSWDNTLKLWDAHSGKEILTLVHLPNREWAALDLPANRIVAASPGAWRYLGWHYRDHDAGRWRVLPAEHFGPLPARAFPIANGE